MFVLVADVQPTRPRMWEHDGEAAIGLLVFLVAVWIIVLARAKKRGAS